MQNLIPVFYDLSCQVFWGIHFIFGFGRDDLFCAVYTPFSRNVLDVCPHEREQCKRNILKWSEFMQGAAPSST